ncbi:MAG: diaminopimelate epimerase [Candidatus Paceibacterota bacterium]|jgi:diaminopimelate epimerase
MITFYKYEGTGNDFIMINNLKEDINLSKDDIKAICDRRFGIGADGVILLQTSDKADLSRLDKADCFMNYYNSDGTLAEMCGNGARCTANFFLKQTNSDLRELSIDTRAGVKKIIINENGTVSVNMGIPREMTVDFPSEIINLENFSLKCVSMGNPHAVMEVDNLEKLDIKTIGPKIENDFHFPNKINVEFVEKIKDDYYRVKVWERGCGETLSCGTGACAVYAVMKKSNPDIKEISLEFSGGKLFLSDNYEGEIILRGPANFVFKGEI